MKLLAGRAAAALVLERLLRVVAGRPQRPQRHPTDVLEVVRPQAAEHEPVVALERVVHVLADDHRAGEGHVGDPAGQVDDRAEHVAVALEHPPAGQADAHVGEVVVEPVGGRHVEGQLGAGDDVVAGEHHLVADHLHDAPAVGRGQVEGDGLEPADHLGQLVLGQLLGLGGEPDEIGEADAHDLALVRGGPDDPPAGRGAEVATPDLVHDPGHAAGSTSAACTAASCAGLGRLAGLPAGWSTWLSAASTSAVAMRLSDEPITRDICRARSASSAPASMKRTTSESISTSVSVNTRSPGRGSGKPERPPQRPQLRRVDARTGRHLDQVVARLLDRHRVLERQQLEGAVLLGPVDHVDRHAEAEDGVAQERASAVGHENDDPGSTGGRPGSSVTSAPSVASARRCEVHARAIGRVDLGSRASAGPPSGAGGGQQGLAPEAGAPPRRVEARARSARGRRRRGGGRAPTAAPGAAPCQRSAERERPEVGRAPRAPRCPGPARPRAAASTAPGRPADPRTAVSRTSRSRTKLSTAAPVAAWWPAPADPPPVRGCTTSGHTAVGDATDSTHARRSSAAGSPAAELRAGQGERADGAEPGPGDRDRRLRRRSARARGTPPAAVEGLRADVGEAPGVGGHLGLAEVVEHGRGVDQPPDRPGQVVGRERRAATGVAALVDPVGRLGDRADQPLDQVAAGG